MLITGLVAGGAAFVFWLLALRDFLRLFACRRAGLGLVGFGFQWHRADAVSEPGPVHRASLFRHLAGFLACLLGGGVALVLLATLS